MVMGEAGAYPRVEHLKGWKGLPETNTLAYYEKSFIVHAPWSPGKIISSNYSEEIFLSQF
jgi:hypothetical protein